MVPVRCTMHLLHCSIKAATSATGDEAIEAAFSAVSAVSAFLWGHGCGPRRERFRHYCSEADEIVALRRRVATLVTACEAGTRTWVDASKSVITEFPRFVEEHAAENLSVSNAQQWLMTKALDTEVANVTLVNAGGVRFLSRLDAAAALMHNSRQLRGFIASEGATVASLPSVVRFNAIDEELCTTGLRTLVDGTLPVVNLMRRLNGEKSPLRAHEVETAVRTMLDELNDIKSSDRAASALAASLIKEISKRWIPHQALWHVPKLFHHVYVASQSDQEVTHFELRLQAAGVAIPEGIVEHYKRWAEKVRKGKVPPTADAAEAWTNEPSEMKAFALKFLFLRPSTAHVEGFFSLMAHIVAQRRGKLSPSAFSEVMFLAANRHVDIDVYKGADDDVIEV